MKISYSVTVCNELEEIKKLIPFLLKYKRSEDEIVVLYDTKNGDPEVWYYLSTVIKNNNGEDFKIHEGEFNNHFAEWKNKLNSLCNGEFIINIDADEIPTIQFMNDVPLIIKYNQSIDLYYIPRQNTLEGDPDQIKFYIQSQRWIIDHKQRINYPDFQPRIYRNSPDIRWEGHVHENIKGYTHYTYLPSDSPYYFLHPKSLERQIKQNNFYGTL